MCYFQGMMRISNLMLSPSEYQVPRNLSSSGYIFGENTSRHGGPAATEFNTLHVASPWRPAMGYSEQHEGSDIYKRCNEYSTKKVGAGASPCNLHTEPPDQVPPRGSYSYDLTSGGGLYLSHMFRGRFIEGDPCVSAAHSGAMCYWGICEAYGSTCDCHKVRTAHSMRRRDSIVPRGSVRCGCICTKCFSPQRVPVLAPVEQHCDVMRIEDKFREPHSPESQCYRNCNRCSRCPCSSEAQSRFGECMISISGGCDRSVSRQVCRSDPVVRICIGSKERAAHTCSSRTKCKRREFECTECGDRIISPRRKRLCSGYLTKSLVSSLRADPNAGGDDTKEGLSPVGRAHGDSTNQDTVDPGDGIVPPAEECIPEPRADTSNAEPQVDGQPPVSIEKITPDPAAEEKDDSTNKRKRKKRKGVPSARNPTGVRAHREYRCTFAGCDNEFSTSGHLARHLRLHTGTKPYSCPIENCHSTFSRCDNMTTHYRSHVKKIEVSKNAMQGGCFPAQNGADIQHKSGDADQDKGYAPTDIGIQSRPENIPSIA